jgi:hypothetical protein
MPYFRRLPPLVRVMSLLGLLFLLAALVVFLEGLPAIQTSFPFLSVDAHRATGIELNLVALSLASTFVVNTFALRFRRTGRQVYPLETWPSQVRWWLLLGTLPLCTLAGAMLLPQTPLFDFVLGVPTFLALLVPVAASVYAADKWYALR